MGQFSFLCKECGEQIKNHRYCDGKTGDDVYLFLIKNGAIVEMLEGEYDGYGKVVNGEWDMDWGGVCDLIFSNSKHNGICAVHKGCMCQSEDDPDQGWYNEEDD